VIAGHWRPDRPDATLAGTIGDEVWDTLQWRLKVRQVYTTPDTANHYRSRHQHDFSVERGEAMLAQTIALPEYVFEARKPGSLIFSARYNPRNYLIVPVKVLNGELWLESLHVRAYKRFVNDVAKAVIQTGMKRTAWPVRLTGISYRPKATRRP
jgi:hypothetical protein